MYISRFQTIILLIILGALIFFREPGLFISPQLWAEEGTLYFQFAYHHSWIQVLLAAHLGYYSLFGNIVSLVAAKLISLEFVAIFYLWISLLVQLAPLLIVIFSKSGIWDALWKKIFGLAIILFTLLSAEIWLNTINSQFYFSLVTLLILLEETQSLNKVKKWIYNILLIISGLSGVVSVFLWPVFLWSLIWDKSRERLIQVGILFLAVIIQLIVFLTTYVSEALYYTRFQGIDFLLISPIILLRTICVLFFGPDISDWILTVFVAPNIGTGFLAVFSALVIVFVLWGFSYLLQVKERVVFVGSYLCLVVLSVIASMGETSSFLETVFMAQRYFYVPNVILALLVFREFQVSLMKNSKFFQYFSGFFVILALFSGVYYFQYSMRYNPDDPSLAQEVRAWRENPNDQIEILPPGWFIKLEADVEKLISLPQKAGL